MIRRAIGLALAALLAGAPAPAATAPRATAVLAGGCFWGLEGVYRHVKGVTNVTSGYAGGSAADANYPAVSSERTGHAEAVRITYDPAKISYGQLLQIFAGVAHDPTELNRQGPDEGPSYRSAIFPQNAAQGAAARAFLANLAKSGTYKKAIVTKVESGAFFPAEAYHQDFMRKNPLYPYIVINDRPKVAALKKRFPQLYRD
jgi:peptide-methionine (S)-S-oxide reductase